MCIRDRNQHLVGQVIKCALKDRDGTDDEEEEQGTETRRSAPQNKIRKNGRPKCYRSVSYTHLDVYKRQLLKYYGVADKRFVFLMQ